MLLPVMRREQTGNSKTENVVPDEGSATAVKKTANSHWVDARILDEYLWESRYNPTYYLSHQCEEILDLTEFLITI